MNKRKISKRKTGRRSIYHPKKIISFETTFRSRKIIKFEKKPILEIEIPYKNQNLMTNCKINSLIYENSTSSTQCDICGLIYTNLLTMHISYKKIIINNQVIRKLKKN